MSTFDPLGGGGGGFAPQGFAPGAQPGSEESFDPNEFAVDFTGVGDWVEFEAWPIGTYDVFVFAAKPGRSKTNNPKITLTLKINPEAHPQMKDRQLTDDLSLTKGGMPRTKMAASAILGRNLEGQVLGAGWWNDLIGKRVKMIVDQEPYTPEGTTITKVSNKVKGYTAVTQSPVDQAMSQATAGLGVAESAAPSSPAGGGGITL